MFRGALLVPVRACRLPALALAAVCSLMLPGAGAQTAVEQHGLAPTWVPLLPQPPRALEPPADAATKAASWQAWTAAPASKNR